MATLQIGSTGASVEILQTNLNVLGANPKLVVDGDFGKLTQDAVLAFQAKVGISVDGVVGPQTQLSIASALNGNISTTSPTIPTGGPTNGIDIYDGDDINSWAEIMNAGFYYAFIKASDGVSPQSGFAAKFKAGKAAGFLCGGYHFYEPSHGVQSQIDAFVAQLQAAGWQVGVDLPPVLDFETFSSSDPTNTDYANANAFLSGLQAALKVKVIIYASDSVITNAPSWISNDIVWDARYNSSGPANKSWTFWQNTGNASVPGLNNGTANSDTDIFQGSISDLKAFIDSSVIS